MRPSVGEIWKENDKRIDREVVIQDIDEDGKVYVRTCDKNGVPVEGSRVSKSDISRFNGKTGGYSFRRAKVN